MTAESTVLISLLVAGHSLADFALQSDAMVRGKNRLRVLLAHGGVVALCHSATLLPFWGSRVAVAIGAITLAHMVIDRVKNVAMSRWSSRSSQWFLLDQLLHILVITLAWSQLTGRVRLVEAVPWAPATLAQAGILISAYAFNIGGMSAIISGELSRLRIRPGNELPAGRVIGVLERLFALTLILLDRWEALGFLMAAKSLARFKELDHAERAEYYLVGTLASLLGASATALVVRDLLRRI